MKALGVVLGLLIVGLATLLLVRFSGHAHGPAVGVSAASGGIDPSQAPRPDHPIGAPLTREQEVRQQFAAKRIPFFRFLKENYGNVVIHFAVTDDVDTLDLAVTSADDQTLKTIVENAVSPTAKQYGFRRIRFYTLNPQGSVEPATLVAESTYDDAGHWNTFRK